MVIRWENWEPFRDLESIQSDLNRLFGRTYGGERGSGEAPGQVAWVPPLDILETQDGLVVHVELPGIEPASVEVSVEDSTLSIRGERRFYENVGEEAVHRVERRYGTFGRSLTLPSSCDPNRIEASFDKGVLTISIPKAEEAKPKKINIKTTG